MTEEEKPKQLQINTVFELGGNAYAEPEEKVSTVPVDGVRGAIVPGILDIGGCGAGLGDALGRLG